MVTPNKPAAKPRRSPPVRVLTLNEHTPPWDPNTMGLLPGDRVMLLWYGDGAIPKSLGYTYATLISFSDRLRRSGGDSCRRSLKWKIKADEDCYGYRLIERDKHIAYVLKGDVWYRFRGS
jgi:hypothetical protein